KVVRIPDRYRLKPHAERPCSDLRLPKLHHLVGRISLTQEHCDSPKLGNEVREQLQALRGDFSRMCGQSGDVSTRASQARQRPISTGLFRTKTIGTDVVAFLAARAAGGAEARMTSTFNRTSSSAS